MEGASLDHVAAGPDSIVYGATFKGAADLGNGRYESLDSSDILIGAFAR